MAKNERVSDGVIDVWFNAAKVAIHHPATPRSEHSHAFAAYRLAQEVKELRAELQQYRAAEPIVAAAEKLVRCKGRYHSELNYRALAALFGVNVPDFPPLKGEDPSVAPAVHNYPESPDSSEDSKRLDWLDEQNKRLNEYYGTSYGWKFDANFQRNAMMLNDSNYPVMTVRQAIDEAMRTAAQLQEAREVKK